MLIDLALGQIVEIFVLIMQFERQTLADKAPMPRLKNIIAIVFWVREDETIFVRIFDKPCIASCFLKGSKVHSELCGSKIYRCAELVFRVPLVRGKFICAGAIGDSVCRFERTLRAEGTIRGYDFQINLRGGRIIQ